jgi:hypothetical protein
MEAHLMGVARKVPLAEALASVDFPVYGLVRPIFGFQHSGTSLECDVFLSYYSEQYMQKLAKAQRHLASNRVISVSTITSRKGSQETYDRIVSPPPFSGTTYTPIITSSAGRDPYEGMEPHVLERAEFLIDETHFIGDGKHYGYPYFYTWMNIISNKTNIWCELHGPDLNEVFEILQSLCALA